MSPRSLFWGCLLALAVLLAWRWDQRPLEHPPGVLAPQAPRQSQTDRQPFEHGGHTLFPRAAFELTARVLSAERYWLDAGARLAPVDLALGWGPMSDQAVLDHVEVSQSARWYRLRWDAAMPLDPSRVMPHSGNMHMIPAQPWLQKLLKDARPGQLLTLRGLLVDAGRPDGWSWRTSLSRDDIGQGSCELVWVEFAQLEPGP